MKKYNETIKIKKENIDFNGHVNNVVYLQLMQDVATNHTNTFKRVREIMQANNKTWFAKKNTIVYNKQIFLNQEIIITTWIDKISITSATRNYEFVEKESNEIVCTGESVWVYVDLTTHKPSKIDPEIKKIFL